MRTEFLTNDEKLDLILKYTRTAHRWAVFRGVISFIFFLIFIVLPVIGGFYLADYAQKNINWQELQKNFEQMKEQFKDLQSLGLQLGQFGADIQQIQKAVTPKSSEK